MTRYRWSLAVVDRWSLFRDRFSTKISRAGIEVVVKTGVIVLLFLNNFKANICIS